MNKLATIGIAFGIAAAVPAAGQVGDAAAGAAVFTPCTACHGTNGGGNADLNAPAIAGQEDWYVLRQLQNFKAGIRGAHAGDTFGAQMAPMTIALADGDLGNLAAHVASLAPVKVPTSLDGDAAAGEALFAPCVACHGADGRGLKDLNSPNLTLQQDWYVVRQLSNFKAGVRGAHAGDTFGAQMAPMAQLLADEGAMKNVAAYLMTLR